ncbi:bifunctional methylenetetrahydrofolate dehydrogenase/methenyltetrahydrofolate cyclohydrolase [Leeia sp. TBRC 13508]|uniref:Bifunctional protein FolD n=1 Tax=Leeia speluncae TaxID=2884804 RepID=A0ABS8D2E0_9NEIS|nr:tetrahydrofolate dehydrogenase/cyclohydrolase catalytic domain-containing protein [Leeia speluncae]MCB6182361.1 bifunctional methylenetetrahydrofolate dehydrogenase/methenyltetrahydrofolate cyclohydrolase [Leeia speluncae]
MKATVLDGKSLSLDIESSLKIKVSNLIEKTGITPVLATILVGDDPSSAIYVQMKVNACHRVGLGSRKIVLPQETSTAELLAVIDSLNQDESVRGILLQHPVPPQIDEQACFDRIDLDKDVDGVTCHGFGRMSFGQFSYGAATPSGVMKLLAFHEVNLSGLNAVVVGRSTILGKPMAQMLLNENATVTICHSRTKHLPEIISRADLIVGAVGKPHFIKSAWIKDGAIVIDAGYHPGGIGDIEVSTLPERSLAYTPVPGGVGPMTISTLISQTVDSAYQLYLSGDGSRH